MTRARRHLQKPIAAAFAAIALSGCVSTTPDPITGTYATPIGGAPVISNETPYSRALSCLAGYSGISAPRVAVGQIADYTGKVEADGSGRKITQGAALMAISALSKAGVRLVERFDTGVAEMELKYSNNRLIGDEEVSADEPYRQILAGSIPGSDFYLVGGITELNYNIRSAGLDGFGTGTATDSMKGNLAAKAYVMNVGLDLRLVDTQSLEVVKVISYQKQIVGREVRAGVFDIFGSYILDVGAAESALEPIQLAVRAVIERAVLEIVADMYQAGPGVCQGIDTASDPLGPNYQAGYGASYGASYSQGYGAPPAYGQSYAPAYAPTYSAQGQASYSQAPARSYNPAQSYSPQTYSPQPYAPQPYAPQPYAPQTYSPQTYSPQAPAIRGRIEAQAGYGTQETYREETRSEAYRWYSSGDDNGGSRGGLW